jgi:phospholipid/cholesterol/gamma-HCH transport system ATP-binding protein
MIRLENVHLALSGKPVLKGISLEVGPGDRVVILGESGIGKSTILRVILGLWKPDRGRVFLEDEDIHRMKEEVLIERRKMLAVVFQGGALFDSLTVGENVGYRLLEEGRLSSARIERIVREKLAAVGLEEAIDLYPAQLSGGMRKRAAIARALAADPRCILFDEPTAGLDPVGACKINQLILECQQAGKGTVVVTHDLDCAYRVGRRLMLISEGRIVFDGDRTAMETSREPALRRFLEPETCL